MTVGIVGAMKLDKLILEENNMDFLSYNGNGGWTITSFTSEARAMAVGDWHFKDEIKDINIIVPNKVVECTFGDGTKEKAVCHDEDAFTLENAITICYCKHFLGDTKGYNKAVRKTIKEYNNKLDKEKKLELEQERIANKKAKLAEKYAQKLARRREEQIEIQKEAYIRAMKEVGNK